MKQVYAEAERRTAIPALLKKSSSVPERVVQELELLETSS
jgi:hypothetical protein